MPLHTLCEWMLIQALEVVWLLLKELHAKLYWVHGAKAQNHDEEGDILVISGLSHVAVIVNSGGHSLVKR